MTEEQLTPKKSPLNQILDDLGVPGWTAPSLILFMLFVGILVWITYAQVDRVVTAPGKVVPLDKVKVVQHLEGGIIESIFVRENQVVKSGESLMSLDLATSGINRGEMRARMASLQLAKIRLEAEAEGRDPVWPEEIVQEFPQMIAAEQATYLSKRDEQRSSFEALDSTILQNRQKLAESKERSKSLEASLVIAKKELALSEGLLVDQLTSQIEHLQRESNVTSLRVTNGFFNVWRDRSNFRVWHQATRA